MISLDFGIFLSASQSTPLKFVVKIPWPSFVLDEANNFDRSGNLRQKEFESVGQVRKGRLC